MKNTLDAIVEQNMLNDVGYCVAAIVFMLSENERLHPDIPVPKKILGFNDPLTINLWIFACGHVGIGYDYYNLITHDECEKFYYASANHIIIERLQIKSGYLITTKSFREYKSPLMEFLRTMYQRLEFFIGLTSNDSYENETYLTETVEELIIIFNYLTKNLPALQPISENQTNSFKQLAFKINDRLAEKYEFHPLEQSASNYTGSPPARG